MLWLLLACAGGDPGGPAADSGGDTAPPGLADNFGVTETEGEAHCENLLDSHCLLPFPSDRFRADDGSLVFGDALPETGGGVRMSDAFFATVDGYGTATPILLQWPGATLDGLPQVFHPEQSLEPDAATLLVSATTGTPIAHWAEWDYLTQDQDDQVLVLRPAEPLPPGETVVVALRGLQDESGQRLPAPASFAALRDQTASTVQGMHARRDLYEAVVFPTVETAGWARDELQLAWSFTVASDDDATRDLHTVRDRLLDALGDDGPTYVIDTIQADPHPSIAYIATGRIQVPSFLQPADDNGLRILSRDADGLPVAGAVEDWEFQLQVPHSAFAATGPVGVLQYGHGFLGSQGEAHNGWLREFADRHQFLILSCNFQGMDEDTMLVWLDALPEDPGWFPWFSEHAMQGVANQLALQRMMASSFLQETAPELTGADGSPLYDPDLLWYYGNSQGGTMGTLMMGLSTDVQRGVLGVPGAAYPFLLHRSTVFTSLSFVFTALFGDSTDASLLLALLGTGFNRLDPLSFAPHIVDDPLPGTPSHQVLLHVAKEDSQVQNQVSFLLGRGVGAVLPTPAVRSVWGLPPVSYPYDGGASLVEYDFGIPDDPTPMDPPPEETDTHGWLRKSLEGQDQMVHFLRTGVVIDTCSAGGAGDGGTAGDGTDGDDTDGCVFDGEP